MDKKDIKYVYEMTGARVFYYRERKACCALWLELGHECKVFFGKSNSCFDVIKAITNARLTNYTFNQ